jgi:hypothetical protein
VQSTGRSRAYTGLAVTHREAKLMLLITQITTTATRPALANTPDTTAALNRITPSRELPDPRIQHLITVEACIFAQHCTCKRGDKRYTSWKEIAETDHNRFTLFPQDT